MSERGKNSKKNTTKQVEKKTTTSANGETTQNVKKLHDDRAEQRIPVQLLVDYKCDGNYLFDFCRDLGAGGIFIETQSPLPQGSTVELTFTLPDSKETLETKGKVIWVQNQVPGKNLTPGMGVQFEQFDKQHRQLLEQFVSRYHAPVATKTDKRTAV